MLHFSDAEFARRRQAVLDQMSARGLEGLLLFAPESQYWLCGHDTFGFCFFQCLVVTRDQMVLLTRSADLRQAQLTSTLSDIRIWKDGADANPAQDLARLVAELGLSPAQTGVETDTHGLTAWNGARVAAALPHLHDASDLVSDLRLTKSDEELAYIRSAAILCDRALEDALPLIKPGMSEAAVLSAMQGAVLDGGGDYPANEFVIGSGAHALLCRYQSGRRILGAQDQLTLEWAGVYRHYHVAAMRTVILGPPRPEHAKMHDAALEALLACEDA
ncbi:MAG: Xaa-Pro peptidase family protein, partial [Pseudomonadota bacterium]